MSDPSFEDQLMVVQRWDWGEVTALVEVRSCP
jgi:hypothetical protein